MLQCVAVCCSNLQCVFSEDLSVLQCVAVCCSAVSAEIVRCINMRQIYTYEGHLYIDMNVMYILVKHNIVYFSYVYIYI